MHKAWTLGATVNGTEHKTYRCRFALLCTGYYDYNEALRTIIPGIDNFRGPVIHPQFWPQNLEYSHKDVVIIGSGATAITLLPVLTMQASHVTMLQRSPSYVLSVPAEDGIERFIRRWFSSDMQDRLMWLKWLLIPFFFVCYPSVEMSPFKAAQADFFLVGERFLLLSIIR